MCRRHDDERRAGRDAIELLVPVVAKTGVHDHVAPSLISSCTKTARCVEDAWSREEPRESLKPARLVLTERCR